MTKKKKARNTNWKKRQYLQQIVLAKPDVCMQKNPNRAILITLNKTQPQMGQRPQYKTRFMEADRRELGNSLELIGEEKTLSTGDW